MLRVRWEIVFLCLMMVDDEGFMFVFDDRWGFLGFLIENEDIRGFMRRYGVFFGFIMY